MTIRRSAAADVARLVEELTSGDARRRQMAGARLAVIGPRATTALLAVASDPAHDAGARITAIEALASRGESRALPLALAFASEADEALALAAIDLLGVVARGQDARAIRAFERLSALAVGTDTPVARRLAALTALEGQPERLLRPLYEALARDPASRVVARVTRRHAGAMESLEAAVTSGLPGDPAVAAALVRDEGERAGLTTLKKAVDAARVREQGAGDAAAAASWAAVRGALHQCLAARNSRLALYDLRETLEQAAGPLPVGFLSAAAAIGNVSCLTPLARAWVEASADDRWWREHLADAFRSIVSRERLTRRHPELQRILTRWPSAAVLVASARR